MNLWDVCFSESLDVRRGLDAEEIRRGLARGEIRDDDLVRPAGSGRKWAPIAEVPELLEPPGQPIPAIPDGGGEAPSRPGGAVAEAGEFFLIDEDEEEVEAFPVASDDELEVPAPEKAEAINPAPLAEPKTEPSEAIIDDADDDRDYGALDLDLAENEGTSISLDAAKVKREAVPDEDEEDTAFTFTRGRVEHVEELDLAPMVDVALQLVLFFLVTAQIVVFKSLEIPAPTPDDAPPTIAAAQPMPPEEAEREFITVAITPDGQVKVNDEPVAADLESIAAKLRGKRAETGLRRILISADAKTRLKYGVLAIDAAQEVGLEIALAKAVPLPGN